MRNIFITAIAGITAAMAGAIYINLDVAIEVTVDTADRVAVSGEGFEVKMVGANEPEKPELNSSGKVEVLDFENALCNIAIDSKEMPENAEHAIKIDGSEWLGSYVWIAIYKGERCLVAADRPGSGYLGSTMAEFSKLPIDTKKRFLRTNGRWFDGDREILGAVPIGHKNAVGNKEFVPVAWANRIDLTHRTAIND